MAYYRHAAQDRQEKSIPIQRDQVREWAGGTHVTLTLAIAIPGFAIPSARL